MNLVDKGLKFPNGLFAPSYVVSNTFGEKEKEKKKDLWPPPLSFQTSPTNIGNVNSGLHPFTGRAVGIPSPWVFEVTKIQSAPRGLGQGALCLESTKRYIPSVQILA